MKILTYIDSSPYASGICDYAVWASTKLALPIELVHVIEKPSNEPGLPMDRSGQLGIDSRHEFLEELVALEEQRSKIELEKGRHLLVDAEAYIKRAGVSAVSSRLVRGELVDHLREHEREARILIIGKRGERASYAEGHLGSNLERVIRASHRPILVSTQEFAPVEKFLFAFDGGASSGKALDRLVQSPLLLAAHGTLLTVGQHSSKDMERLEDALSRLKASGYQAEIHIRDGDPDEVIPDMINNEDFDLLVMGAYGHSRIRELLIGSTTTHLLRTSKKPVIVVR